jgi:hypothetical protein
MDAEEFALEAQDEPPEPLTVGGWPIIAQLIGGVGVFLGLIVTLIFSTVGDINHLAGGHLSPLRGVLGLLGALLGGAGVVLLSRRRGLAAILLVLAAALYFVAFHLYGLIASPFLLIGALLSFAGRAPADPSATFAAPPDA